MCPVVVDSCKDTVTQAGKLKGNTHHHDFIDLFYIQNVIASAVACVLLHAVRRWMWCCSSGSRSYLGAPPIQAGVSYDVVRGVNMGKELFDNDPEGAEGICNPCDEETFGDMFSGIERDGHGMEMLDSPRQGLDEAVKASNTSLGVEVEKS